MAALDRPKFASYEEHESVWVDTEDNEDHTFCGIMFPLRVKNNLPVEHILLHSISVRGRLGDLTVHVSNEVTTTPGTTTTTTTPTEIPLHASHWTQIYQGRHKMTALGRNRRRRGGGGGDTTYAKLEFPQPLLLKPGQVRLLYVHSTHDGDESIVYDNSSGANFNAPRYQDDFIALHTGKAHLSPEPFGQSPIWGWGNAWRDRREFVGQLSYGVVYKLWNPEVHKMFGHNFGGAVHAMLVAQRRYPVGKLPDECLYYIMNMCKWDWFDDSSDQMKTKYRARKKRKADEVAAAAASSLKDDRPSATTTTTAIVPVAAVAADGDVVAATDPAADYERFHGYRADNRVFHLDMAVSSDEDSDDDANNVTGAAGAPQQRQRGWFRRQFARINVLPRYHHHHHHHYAGSDDNDDDDDDDIEEDSDDEDAEVESVSSVTD